MTSEAVRELIAAWRKKAAHLRAHDFIQFHSEIRTLERCASELELVYKKEHHHA